MKRRSLFLSVLLICTSSAAYARCPVEQTSRSYKDFERAGALLFIVDNCTGKSASYVYGTVHSDSPEVKAIAAPAFEALKNTDQVGFEYIAPTNAAQVTASAMFIAQNAAPLIPQILNKQEYKILLDALAKERGMEEKVVERMQPWAAAVLMQLPRDTADGLILDDRLKQQAQLQKKTLFGLETLSEQLQVFQRIPANQQTMLLKESLQDREKIELLNRLLQEAYTSKNLEALAALGEESFASIKDVKLREYMHRELLIRRNHNMAQRLLPQLRNGGTMVAVGALHLTGAEGVLNLLQQEGYRIIAFVPERYAKAKRQE